MSVVSLGLKYRASVLAVSTAKCPLTRMSHRPCACFSRCIPVHFLNSLVISATQAKRLSLFPAVFFNVLLKGILCCVMLRWKPPAHRPKHELLWHFMTQNAHLSWFAGHRVPLRWKTTVSGYLKRAEIFFLSYHRSSEQTFSLSNSEGNTFFIFFWSLKMKKGNAHYCRSPSCYNVSGRNYDHQQLEGRSGSGAIGFL